MQFFANNFFWMARAKLSNLVLGKESILKILFHHYAKRSTDEVRKISPRENKYELGITSGQNLSGKREI